MTPEPAARRRKPLVWTGLAVSAAAALYLDPFGWSRTAARLEAPDRWHQVDAREQAAWHQELSRSEDQPAADVQAFHARLRAWQLDAFRKDLEKFASWGSPSSPEIGVVVYSEPSSPPDLLTGLNGGAAAERQRIESSLVESRALAFIADVDAHELLRFHAFSMFELEGGVAGDVVDASVHGPLFGSDLPEALLWKSSPRLPSNHGVRRELTAGGLLRNATRFTNSLVLDLSAEIGVYRWGLLRDDAPADGSEVRLSSGVLFARDVPGGALLWHHSFYAGQHIPSPLKGLASDRIAASLRSYLREYTRRAPSWAPRRQDPGPRLEVAPDQGR